MSNDRSLAFHPRDPQSFVFFVVDILYRMIPNILTGSLKHLSPQEIPAAMSQNEYSTENLNL